MNIHERVLSVLACRVRKTSSDNAQRRIDFSYSMSMKLLLVLLILLQWI